MKTAGPLIAGSLITIDVKVRGGLLRPSLKRGNVMEMVGPTVAILSIIGIVLAVALGCYGVYAQKREVCALDARLSKRKKIMTQDYASSGYQPENKLDEENPPRGGSGVSFKGVDNA